MKKWDFFWLSFSAAISTFILSFIITFLLLHCIQRFFEIDSRKMLIVVIGISLLFTLIYVVLFGGERNATNKSKLDYWIDQNYPKLILSYLILTSMLISLAQSPLWSADEIKDVLNIEWTIFGLALTVFWVWNVIIIEYLKKKEPIAPKELDSIQKYDHLKKQHSFSQEVDTTTLIPIVLLSINLLLLIVSTVFVYIINLPEMVSTQNLVLCTFFFSSNSIIMLFFNMLKPFKQNKESLKQENQVTRNELDAAKAEAIAQKLVDGGIKTINESDKYTEEQKKELSKVYLELIKEAFHEAARLNDTK